MGRRRLTFAERMEILTAGSPDQHRRTSPYRQTPHPDDARHIFNAPLTCYASLCGLRSGRDGILK